MGDAALIHGIRSYPAPGLIPSCQAVEMESDVIRRKPVAIQEQMDMDDCQATDDESLVMSVQNSQGRSLWIPMLARNVRCSIRPALFKRPEATRYESDNWNDKGRKRNRNSWLEPRFIEEI